jgi:hypothetical protein
VISLITRIEGAIIECMNIADIAKPETPATRTINIALIPILKKKYILDFLDIQAIPEVSEIRS